ncbi:hypothetical protein XSR1_250027 [Xenorhabdus szentirmaii DSM 16338]|uniref:Uncharacterized protein n=1 Tax=Xenorhabdus szentirmaii DSM 16338 TaxID=1427518 RepID=W1IYY9_9GAMM|nr:hypothetical protein XSR1_250027 [Xenorhabdus szentirmaii DSM 16338]
MGLTEHNEEKNTFHNIINYFPDRNGGAFPFSQPEFVVAGRS